MPSTYYSDRDLNMAFEYEKVKGILVCPRCKGELVHDGDSLVCVNPETRWSYPIVDDIPRLLVDEAKELPTDDWREVMLRQGRNATTGQPG